MLTKCVKNYGYFERVSLNSGLGGSSRQQLEQLLIDEIHLFADFLTHQNPEPIQFSQVLGAGLARA